MSAVTPAPPAARRTEVQALRPAEADRVRHILRVRRARCPACGGRRFAIGDVLYLGFLFAAADLDEHMVALTCTRPGCPHPRTGIRLRGKEFLGRRLPRE